MAIRNCQDVVEVLRQQYPEEWAAAHSGGPQTEAFIRRLAWVLHSTIDQGFGLLGQYGDPRRIADDAIMYLGEGPGTDVGTGRPQSGFDVIASAGSPAARPAWIDISGPGRAIWVQPTPPTGGVDPAPVSEAWTPAHQAVIDRLRPSSALMAAEQLGYAFPREVWGGKRSAAGRPVSGDTAARRLDDGRLYGVRVLPTVHLWGVLDSAQVFEPVAPVNHLGADGDDPGPVDPDPGPVDPPPEDDPPPADTEGLAADVAARVMEGLGPTLDALVERIDALALLVIETREQARKAASQSYDVQGRAGWVGPVTGTITPKE